MFTGFASENTPSVQVWNCNNTISGNNTAPSIYLTADCAEIQFFKTGTNTTSISVYLPSDVVEGKKLSIINVQSGSNQQQVAVYASDTASFGARFQIYSVGGGEVLHLCYSRNFLSWNPSASGNFQTGWVSLNKAWAGSNNYYATVVGGNVNVATGQSSAVIGGTTNTASASNSSVIGGASNTASGIYSCVLSCDSSTASGFYSASIGGQVNAANSNYSIVIGGSYGTTRSIIGNFVVPASNSPLGNSAGLSQSGLLILGVQTTNATVTTLRSNTIVATTNNQVILPNNSAYYFRGSVIANVTGGGNTKAWSFEGAIKRGASAATTAIVGATIINVIAQDAGASTWTIALAADTTNGGLQVTVTGQAATTIRWVCQVQTTEVTF